MKKLLAIAMLLLVACSAAQAAHPLCTVTGVVLDSNANPCANCPVFFDQVTTQVVSGDTLARGFISSVTDASGNLTGPVTTTGLPQGVAEQVSVRGGASFTAFVPSASTVLFSAFATNSNVSGGTGTFTNVTASNGTFTNLTAGPGNMSITGNRTTGADQMNSVSVGGIINVQTYGASPSNSASANATAIQAAFNAAHSTSQPVYFPPGTYTTNTITYQGQSFFGAGEKTSIIQGVASSDVFVAPDPGVSDPQILAGSFVHDIGINVNNSVDAHTSFPDRSFTGANGNNPTIGNCAFAFPNHNGNFHVWPNPNAGALLHAHFLNIFIQNVGGASEANSSCAWWSQTPSYDTTFQHITITGTTYGYIEELENINSNSFPYAPDLNQFLRVSILSHDPFIAYNGDDVTVVGLQLYASNSTDWGFYLLKATTSSRTQPAGWNVDNIFVETNSATAATVSDIEGAFHVFGAGQLDVGGSNVTAMNATNTTIGTLSYNGAGGSTFVPATFSTLGTCTGNEGKVRSATNSSTNTWGANCDGAGALHVLCYCDGTNWTVMGK